MSGISVFLRPAAPRKAHTHTKLPLTGQGGRGNQPHQLLGPSSTQKGGRQSHHAAAGTATTARTARRRQRAKEVRMAEGRRSGGWWGGLSG